MIENFQSSYLWLPKEILVAIGYGYQVFLITKPCGNQKISINVPCGDWKKIWSPKCTANSIAKPCGDQIFLVTKPYYDQKFSLPTLR